MKKELFKYKIDDDTEVSKSVVEKLNNKLETDLSNLPEVLSEEVKSKFRKLIAMGSEMGATSDEATASGSLE